MKTRQIEAELLADAGAQLGEGPLWDEDRLLWLGIDDCKLFSWDGSHRELASFGFRVGAIVPDSSGGYVLATENGFYRMARPGADLEFICDPEAHIPTNRFNDGKCGPDGRFVAGTMACEEDEPDAGSLYSLEAPDRVSCLRRPVTISNGLAWSADGRVMYYIDTMSLAVTASDYDLETGAADAPRKVIGFDESEGYPDGMSIDAQGNLWIARWGGGRVSCYNPDSAALLAEVRLPVSQVTSCCFGGDDFQTLFITSAAVGIDKEKEPLAGGLFCARPGVSGLPADRFQLK